MDDQTLGKTIKIDFGGQERTIKKLSLRKYKELGKAGAELFNILPDGKNVEGSNINDFKLIIATLENGPEALANLVQVATGIPSDTIMEEDLESVALLAVQVWKFNSPNLAVQQIKKAMRPETKEQKPTS